MLEALKGMLSFHAYDNDLKDPVMITFTTRFPPTLRGKFLTLRWWDRFRSDMATKLPYREYHFQPIISSMEFSENAVHIHVIADDITNVNILQELWTKLNRHDLGSVYANMLDNFESGFDYIMKEYVAADIGLDKFFGLYVKLHPEGIYIDDE